MARPSLPIARWWTSPWPYRARSIRLESSPQAHASPIALSTDMCLREAQYKWLIRIAHEPTCMRLSNRQSDLGRARREEILAKGVVLEVRRDERVELAAERFELR